MILCDYQIASLCLGKLVLENREIYRNGVDDNVFGFIAENHPEALFEESGSVVWANRTIEFTREKPADFKPLISPFVSSSMNSIAVGDRIGKCPSYGVSPFGYDLRVSDKFKVYRKPDASRINTRYIDTVGFPLDTPDHEEPEMEDVRTSELILLPGDFALGVSMERICVPSNITVVCMAKSTLARIGLEVTVTPLEAGWEGYVTLEFVNKNPYPIKLRSGIGVCQAIFHKGERCAIPYNKRKGGGKYQDQPARPVSASF